MRVYVYCAGTSYWPPNHSTLYQSDDGGKTWRAAFFSDPRFAQRKLYNVEDDYVSRQWKQREQAPPRSVAVCGGNPDVVAMCTSAWCLRTDDGATWEPFTTLPFRNIQRVVFDPARPKEIILTTFGSSILRGPAEP